MKLRLLVLALSYLTLTSCSLFSKKNKIEEEAPSEGPAIPPPNHIVSESEITSPPSQDTQPESSTEPAKEKKVQVANNLTQSGDFVFRDPLKDLPSNQDIDTPVINSPSIPKPLIEEGSSLVPEAAEPLLVNP